MNCYQFLGKRILRLLFMVVAGLLTAETVQAQGTAFTYQGRLNTMGGAANGSYDFQFIVFNVNSNGVSVGPVLTNAAVSVTNGLFTTTLDFGAGVFTGANLWLDISVRTNGSGVFSELVPRQQLTPTPYAIFANTASNVNGTVPAAQISGAMASANLVGTYSNVVTLSDTANQFTGTYTGSGGGLTNLIQGTVLTATNYFLTWNNQEQLFSVTNTPNFFLFFTNGWGDASFNFTVTNNLYGNLFNNTNVIWLSGSNSVVTNTGILTATAYGTLIRVAMSQP